MPRRIKKALIKRISLCPRGANQLPVLYKEDGNFSMDTLTKFNEDLGEITAIVYAPEVRDSQGDIASAEVIKDMMYQASKDGLPDVNIMHKGESVPKDKAFVAQSFIVEKNDERFASMTDYSGNPVDVTGAWAVVIKIEDEDLRKSYKDGEWNGVSMEGTATVVAEKSDDGFITKLTEALKSLIHKEEITVTAEELKAVMAENNEALAKSLVEALKPKEPAKPEEPVTKTDELDLNDPVAVEAHLAKLKVAKLDLNDPAAVEAHLASLKKSGTTEDDLKKAEAAKIKALEDELADLKKASGQPATTTETELEKEEREIEELAKSIASKSFLAPKQ